MRSVLFSKKSKPDPELLALKAELRTAQSDLANAYCQFNQALDPELVESCIYQISAVKARCNYLIRSIKERSPEALTAFNTVPVPGRHHVRGEAGPDGERCPADEDDGGSAAWT